MFSDDSKIKYKNNHFITSLEDDGMRDHDWKILISFYFFVWYIKMNENIKIHPKSLNRYL